MAGLNPFHFGIIVSGEDFCNREAEINEIEKDIRNHQNSIIYSPRRYGKSSLIFEVFRRLAGYKNIITVYVNLYSMLTERDFVDLYNRALFKALTKTPRTILELIGRYLKSIRPKVTVKPDGGFDIGIEYMPEINEALEDIMAVPLRYAEETGKTISIAFDEFQQIVSIQNTTLERKVRNIIQEHSGKISYIFLGSKRHVMEEMFFNPNQPFYRAAKHIPLTKIERSKMLSFIIKKFSQTGKKISKECAEHIVDTVDNHPYYIQHLCHSLWDLSGSEIDMGTIHSALFDTLSRESAVLTEIWDRLKLNQRKVMVALGLKKEQEGIYSQEVLHRYRLPPVSTLQKALRSLLEQELIHKVNGDYQIEDVFFKLWIKNNYNVLR
jgi:AAA+ ATPase superfamily predicted ATPase